MIKLIRTYAGYSRPEGYAKVTIAYMYHCSKCMYIKNILKELRNSGCTHEIKKRK